MTYAIKEMFRTIQGEGFHVGTPAYFVRFAGCNMWSGRPYDRERDAIRTGAECPRWCDTDFVGGDKMSAWDIAKRIVASPAVPLIVLTGGEPLLQVDEELLDVLTDQVPEARIAIETNGTVEPKFARPSWGETRQADRQRSIPWITLSPKLSRERTKLEWANEVKLVVPDYAIADWQDFKADHWFVSPRALTTGRDVDAEAAAALLVRDNYRWRLSLQTHKVLGVP